MTREEISKFITSIKKNFKRKPQDSWFFVAIIFLIIIIQIVVQWRVITQKYPLPGLDTYGWVGHMWFLLENGYFWRERYPIHYPRGFIFFILAPVLINPNYKFTYLYFKLAGIPIMSFYLIIMAIILKQLFKKNYLVLVGLMLTLISNIILSRFSLNSSSTIPTIMILASIIIFRSKCPFYLIAFFIQLMFLFNPLYALCYVIILGLLIFFRVINKDYVFKKTLIDFIIKPIILYIFLLLTFIIHTLIVQQITFIDLINAFLVNFGIRPLNINFNITFMFLKLSSPSINVSDILKNIFPKNNVIDTFRDLERRTISFFIIITFVSLFLPAKKMVGENYKIIINFGKLSLLIIIGFYIVEALFIDSSNIFAQNLGWFITRVTEALTGPIIILSCFAITFIIDKARIFTLYLRYKYSLYDNLLRSKIHSKFLKIENIMMIILLISLFSTFIVHRNVTYYAEFDE
ncbi:MAG: hypothetical protein EU532_13395 [Promethearchaeota archaeon]|nr:MAG: hypothetical protein EU532_13395 [Candidatus Lokiarchaeota archaeon]